MGLGGGSSGLALADALRCLAASGHTRGRDLIRYHLSLAKKSHSDADRLWVLHLESYLGLWDVCRECITSGEAPTTQVTLRTYDGKAYQRPYRPAQATLAMRRLYAADAASLDWDREIDGDYLQERFQACAPVLRDREKCIQTSHSSFGRFYESLLAPMVLDWLNGKGEALEKAFGGELPKSGYSRDSRRGRVAFVQKLCASMTGPPAAKAKLMLEAESGTTGYGLLCCDPRDWLPDYLKQYGDDAGRAATAITALGMLQRALTDDEADALPPMLSLPRLRFSYRAEEYALKPLAQKHPDAFVAALQSPHLSKEVVNTILAEKLSDDRQLILGRIEYGMLHQYDRAALSPEELAKRIAKMPPHIRARAMSRMGQPRRRRIDTKWLTIVQTHFAGDQGVRFLQALAQKKDFASAKRQIESTIRAMQKQ